MGTWRYPDGAQRLGSHDRCRIKPGLGVRRVPELCPHLRLSVTCGLRLDDHIERAQLTHQTLNLGMPPSFFV